MKASDDGESSEYKVTYLWEIGNKTDQFKQTSFCSLPFCVLSRAKFARKVDVDAN